MSAFDKLTLELISRPSITGNARLGLAELQLQRADRWRHLMTGGSERGNDTVRQMRLLRDRTLAKLVEGREEEKLRRTLADIGADASVHDASVDASSDDEIVYDEVPSRSNVHSRTPTPADTPAERARAGAAAAAAAAQK